MANIDMTKDGLLALAAENGIEVPAGATKAEIVALLEAIPAEEEATEEVIDFTPQAALALIGRIAASDSRWADMSATDPAVVAYAVERGWLETDDRNVTFGRYMLTKRGIRALETD